MMNSTGNQTSLRILALGALLGISIALAVVLGNVSANSWTNSNQPLSVSVIAKVNSTEVRLLEYQRALKMLADDRRDAITDLDRELVLQRLIDEELLIQQGINAGLVRTDMAVRTVVLQSILAGIMTEIEASDGQEQALEDYLTRLKATADIQWTADWAKL
ncbi:SurA N-terminal domain-containing protein [Porticoccaceae bacterium]|nr:SurA N-terminal domain-containing protein [Porticoccaceae bacterium]